MPTDEDEVLQDPAFAQQTEEQQMDGGDANDIEKFPDPATHAQQLMDNYKGPKANGQQPPNGQPPAPPPADKARPGKKIHAVENGKWRTKQVPYGDTGERRKVGRRAARYRKFGYTLRKPTAAR
jgi:hypothetical protein